MGNRRTILAKDQAVASMNVMFLRSALSMESGIAPRSCHHQQAASEIGNELALREGLSLDPPANYVPSGVSNVIDAL